MHVTDGKIRLIAGNAHSELCEAISIHYDDPMPLQIGGDPAQLMLLTIAPDQATDLPDVASRTTLRTAANNRSALQRKGHNVV